MFEVWSLEFKPQQRQTTKLSPRLRCLKDQVLQWQPTGLLPPHLSMVELFMRRQMNEYGLGGAFRCRFDHRCGGFAWASGCPEGSKSDDVETLAITLNIEKRTKAAQRRA